MPDVADDVKYSEIRDIPWEKRRLLVKHEDSKRDDFCNDFNFGFF